MNNNTDRYFGKYRGQIVDNQDPLELGRIKAIIPAVFEDKISGWAMPCAPHAGRGFFCIPKVGAMIWIEFESGNPEKPIWTGYFWNKSNTADKLPSPDVKILETNSTAITLNDTIKTENITLETTADLKIKAKSITLETDSGVKIIMDQKGIELSNRTQKIKISASNVTINNGALEVI
jgi:uncharacterized protein involved in type VI secretion and phage assembly